jgi:SAM-dependent methyltransferase
MPRLGHDHDARFRAPMGYFDWHREPGYFGDVTRHFTGVRRVLDVGAGTGWMAAHFDDYTGVDGSQDAVDEAQAAGRNVLLADLREALPFPDATFDGVIAKDVLEHLPDPGAVVREIRRVLVPGGVVFASSPDAQRSVWDDYTHVRPFTRRGFRKLFTDQGLTVEQSGFETIVPGSSIVSGWTRAKRRPLPLRALSRVRFLRRNVWVVARA